MKVVVNSKSLYQQLQLIQSVVPKNPMLPILECILFEIKENTLSMTASDLHITSITSMPIEKSDEGSLAIPATILINTLQRLPDQALTLSFDENSYRTRITAESGSYQISCENPADFPRAPEIEEQAVVELPLQVLREAFAQTSYAISTDELRPALNGIYVQIEQGISFVATDGHRLAKYFNPEYSSETAQSIIIPKKTVQTIQNLINTEDRANKVRVVLNPNNAEFKFEQVRLISRLIDENYPDYKNVVPSSHTSSLTINKEIFREAVERINIFTNRATGQMRIKIAGNTLELLAEDLDYSNEGSERIACSNYTGEDIEIGFNARFLIDVTKTLPGENLELRLNQAHEAAIISPISQDETADETANQNFALVMPIMLN